MYCLIGSAIVNKYAMLDIEELRETELLKAEGAIFKWVA